MSDQSGSTLHSSVHSASVHRALSYRASLYGALMRGVFQKWIVPRFASAQRINEGRSQWESHYQTAASQKKSSDSCRIWWHAASVGELEILWPVILDLARRSKDGQTKRPIEFVLTVLSESARDRLHRLSMTLNGMGLDPVFAGYSPWEGDWEKSLKALSPDLFVTSKYEAWPELWVALSSHSVPLTIVSAKNRKSLKICRNVCEALGGVLPKMNLLTAISEDVSGLSQTFPDAKVSVVGEPRWDQVWARAKAGNSRAREISTAMSALPKPWGVLGSVWSEDLNLWKDTLCKVSGEIPGTALLVPHRVDVEHLRPLEEMLGRFKIRYIKTSAYKTAEGMTAALQNLKTQGMLPQCVLVDEMGFLSELYAVADWSYVGGGIGRRGVHSTIEPAIHGIPISCGTYRAHQFVEIAELKKTGQLAFVQTASEVASWIQRSLHSQERESWKAQALSRLGATDRIVESLRDLGSF